MAQLLTNLDQIPNALLSGALAVGNFDGVHRGHAQLISDLVEAAASVGGPAIVLTFDPPPQAVLQPERRLSLPLTTIQRRFELLSALGVDGLIAYPTDKRLLSLSPVQFFEQVLVGRLQARAMVEGPNFRFGRDRTGDVKLLKELCSSQEMDFRLARTVADADGMISSTRIRGLLANGDVGSANQLLTQDFELCGMVTSGSRRGRELGFPTANLTEIQTVIPAHGVYSARVGLDGQEYPAAVNIGPTPTFDDPHPKVEVHIIGWEGRLYGQRLACRLKTWIRGIRKFLSLDELRAQIEKDVALCQSH